MPVIVEFRLISPVPQGYPVSIQELKEAFKRGRIDKNATQKDAANAIGVDVCTYRLWEWGKSFPRPEHWQAIRNYFKEVASEIGFYGITDSVSLKEAAKMIGVSPWTLIEWIERGKIPSPCTSPGCGDFVFSKDQVLAIIEAKRHK